MARHVALLGWLACVCVGALACDQAESGGESVDKPADTAADPSGPGALEDDQVWRLELDGDDPKLTGVHAGKVAYVLREGDELMMSFGGSASGLVLSLTAAPVGSVTTLDADPAAFYATLAGVDCTTARGGRVEVTLTHNAADRVAGSFEGTAACTNPAGTESRWLGRFDHRGSIDQR